MSKTRLDDPELQNEYRHLFNTCRIRPDRLSQVDSISSRIRGHEAEYREVADAFGIPWYFIGLIHQMESGGNFHTHLHNGDPLDKRTVRVPAGRPVAGQPPFTWKESAIDAIQVRKWDQWKDWSLPGMLYQLELYNGWGYRHQKVHSAYLWSCSQHYTCGKYIADHVWSATAVSDQIGAAVVLRRMADTGFIHLADVPEPPIPHPPLPQRTYLVNKGDTLGAIARRHGVSLSELISINPQIENPNLIYPGQEINLPGTAPVPSPEPSPPEPPATLPYMVRSGDTLWSIAAAHGLSLDALLRLNREIISPGQILNVPRVETPPAPGPDLGPVGGDPRWLEIAIKEMEAHIAEIPGPENNPEIEKYFRNLHYHFSHEETDYWCSAFVNWCVEEVGLKGTDSAAAVSWLKWGQKLETPRRGCIVVFWRKEEGVDPDHGHVGFYYGEQGGRIQLLGGNQRDQVNVTPHRKELARGYRWPQNVPS